MNISYDSYRVFYYAAKYKSFSQAAAALYNNQPNVTRIIRRLESELRCALFFRSPQGVRLTPEGEKLYAHIAVAFESIEAAEEEIFSDQSLQSGVVHIAASGLALRGCLLQVLAQYRSEYPHVRICLTNHTTPQGLAAVQNGRMTLYFNPNAGETCFFHELDTSVGLLKLIPGADIELLRFMLGRYHALVIESFGVGGLPDYDREFRAEIEKAASAGKLIALTTQVQSEGTDTSVYSVGSGLADIGVLEAFDMTPEACFTKLMWILAQTDDPIDRRRLFYKPICHDILPPVSYSKEHN